MLTPRDIHEAEFRRVWKGYSPEEVDEFLQRVVHEYETVYKENVELREKVKQLEERLAKYTSSEMQIALTLEAAKEAAADAKAAAEKEAQATLIKARAQADEIIARAARLAAARAQALIAVQENFERFRASAAGALKTFLAEMESWEIDIPEAVREVASAGDLPREDEPAPDEEEERS